MAKEMRENRKRLDASRTARPPKTRMAPMSNAIARKLHSIQAKSAMRSVDVASVLGTRPETVSRWNQGKASPRPGAEKLLLDLEYIADQLADFYEPADIRLWLFSRQKLLNGETPAALIQQGRASKVIAVVDQLRDGVFI